jgi:ankyrin repeat protein
VEHFEARWSDKNVRQAVCWAAFSAKWDEVVPAVRDEGFPVNIIGKQGVALLHLACGVRAGGGESLVRLLLEHGADPNLRDTLGCTPLWYAAGNGTVGMMRMLMAAGACVCPGSEVV